MATANTDPRKRPARYDSPAMAERRSIILDTARSMIAADENITMRGLAKKSGVALATLYNIFSNQDRLVAEAVVEVFEDRLVHPWDDPDIDFFTAARLLRESIYEEILRVPAFAKKMVAIYFDVSTNNPIRKTLHDISTRQYEALLLMLEKDGAPSAWYDRRSLAEELTAAQYAQVARWAAGDLTIEQLEQVQRRIILTHVAAMDGAIAAEARSRLARK